MCRRDEHHRHEDQARSLVCQILVQDLQPRHNQLDRIGPREQLSSEKGCSAGKLQRLQALLLVTATMMMSLLILLVLHLHLEALAKTMSAFAQLTVATVGISPYHCNDSYTAVIYSTRINCIVLASQRSDHSYGNLSSQYQIFCHQH